LLLRLLDQLESQGVRTLFEARSFRANTEILAAGIDLQLALDI
jgi:hypothetical protein